MLQMYVKSHFTFKWHPKPEKHTTTPPPPLKNKIELPFPTPSSLGTINYGESPILQSVTVASAHHHWCNHSNAFSCSLLSSTPKLVIRPFTLIFSCPQLLVAISSWQNSHFFFPLSHKSVSIPQYIFFMSTLRAAPSCSLYTLLMSTEKQQGTRGKNTGWKSGVDSKSSFP